MLKSRGKPFPRSCPLKIKDSVMLSSREHVETLKLRKRTRLSPIPKDFLVFPVKRCPSPCAVKTDPSTQALHIYVLLCIFPSTAPTTKRTLRDVCTWEMDGGAGWGTPGTWRWLPLIHTFLAPHLYLQLPGDGCSVDPRRNVMGEVPVRMVTTHGVTGADRHPSVCWWRRAACHPQKLFILFSSNNR